MWDERSLDSVCTAIVDCPHSTPQWTNEGVVVLRSQNIRNGRLNFSSQSFTDEEHYQQRIRRAVPTVGDIVITREAPMGEVAMIPHGLHCCLGQRMVLLRPDTSKVDGRYLLFALQSPRVQAQILVNEGTGSTVSNLRIPLLENLRIPAPPIEEQRTISHILGTLDDKIELNRQMNQTLDELARTLFRSWFVDFDPVRAKAEGRQPEGMDAETAALFPDRFVDSELGPIPEGWEWGQLGQIADNVRVNVPVNELMADDNYIGLDHFGKRQIALYEWGSADEVTSNKSRFLENDVLFGKLRPYFHKVSLAPIGGVCSTDILVIRPKRADDLAWVLAIAASDQMIEQATQRSSGTRMPRANWADVGGFSIAKPPLAVMDAFARVAQPMLELVKSNLHESRTLMDLRDVLLPELLSGRLSVPSVAGFAGVAD